MVRLAWQVEDGSVVVAKRHQVSFADVEGCLHVQADIELTSKHDAVGACFTMPANALTPGQVLKTGILFLHEAKPNAWNSVLANSLAVSLASVGYMVVRSKCAGRRQLREVAGEKAMMACSGSPYGNAVRQWIIVGFGTGCHIATRLSASTRQVISGMVLLSFPVQSSPASLKAFKGIKAPQGRSQAEECLLRFSEAILMVQPEMDASSSLDSIADLVKEMNSQDARMILIEGCDKHLRPPKVQRIHPSTVDEVTNTVLEFVSALHRGSVKLCTAPSAAQVIAHAQSVGKKREGHTERSKKQEGAKKLQRLGDGSVASRETFSQGTRNEVFEDGRNEVMGQQAYRVQPFFGWNDDN